MGDSHGRATGTLPHTRRINATSESILPGRAWYDEVAGAGIAQALRFTAARTRQAYVYPPGTPPAPRARAAPMGLRVRLRASTSLAAGLGPQARAVAVALQRYGMILADNGSPWFVTGAPDARWDDDDLSGLGRLPGADFEVVDTPGLRNG